VILLSYSRITGLYGLIFTVLTAALLVLSLALTAFRYKNYFNSRMAILSHIIFLLAVSSILYFYLTGRISDLISDKNLPEFISNVPVKIDKVKYKRYSSELYFSTQTDTHHILKGILYFQGDMIPGRGDSIFIHKKIYKVKLESKNTFSSHLVSRGIHYTSGISDNDITLLEKSNASTGSALQSKLLAGIDSIFTQPASGVIKALFTGNQNYINKNVIINYRNSGVLHSLAASGMHVGIFAAIPAFLLIPFFRKNIAMLGSFIFVLFYLYITDLPVSLIRAVIMFGFFYFQSILFRKRNIFNYLMLTCSTILIISPWEIFSPGFQLSFGATAGIILFYKKYLESLNRIPSFLAGTIAVTLSAQIFTIPMIIFHMNQLNTAGIVSNILIIPLITIIMGTSLFSILLSFISMPAAVLSGFLPDYIFKLSLIITGFISDLKLNFYIYSITPALFFLLMTGLIPLINHRRILKLKFYPVLISVILCTLYMKKNYSSSGKNYMINAGRSTAQISTENEKQILKLKLEECADTDKMISEIKIKNPDIKIIELEKNSSTGLLLSKLILNEYTIEEYRFTETPDISPMFKKIIHQLEQDNVTVKFI
jgi:competence protein ComEC